MLLWLLCAAVADAGAAVSGAGHFRNVSLAGQLLDMTVSSVLRDSTGYVWLGNGLGVDRYDGVRVRHYPLPGKDVKDRRVNALAQMPGGDVYAGNGDGLWRLRRGEASFVRADGGPGHASAQAAVNALQPSADGKSLYLGTSNGLYRYYPGDGRREAVPLVDSRIAAASNRVSDIAMLDSTLFLATGAGVIILNDSTPILYDYPVPVNSVAVAAGRLYLGTSDSGLLTFDISRGTIEPFDGIGSNVITDIAAGADGTVYVATDGAGVCAIDPREGRIVARYSHTPGLEGSLSSNAVYAVYPDSRGLLWVGYYQLGASHTLYSADVFSTFSDGSFSTAGRAVRVVLRQGPRTLLGTRDGVIVIDAERVGDGRVRHISQPALRSNMIISAAWYGGRFVVGTYGGGMQAIDPATGEVSDCGIEVPDYPFRKGHVFSLTAHPDGSLWCGTSAGLFRFGSDGRMRSWTSENSQLPQGNVYDVFFDSRGNGWICTENGLAVYDPARGTVNSSLFPKGFFNQQKFKEVYQDSRGRLYFLPEHGRVYTTNMAMTEFGTLDAPGGDELEPRALVEDNDACLWLATSNGIFSRGRDSAEWVEFGSTDGVVSPLFINCTPAADADGRLWFGNSYGLLTVRPHEAGHNLPQSSFSLRLSDVLVNGSSVGAIDCECDGDVARVSLPRHAGSITLQLTPLNYADPMNLHYRYRLDGGEWHDLDRDFDLSFYDLSGGTHRLCLRQAGRSDTQTVMELRVPYPAWMWICVGLALLAMLSFGVSYILHVRRNREAIAAKRPPETAAEAAAPAGDEAGDGEEAPKASEESRRKYRTYTMNEDEGRAISAKLDRIMDEQKPYTDPELHLSDLAELAGVSGHRLSFYFSQYLHVSFYDYVNRRRVDEFKRLAASPDAARRYTLSALSAKAGFSSRTTFFRYFKKVEGITPAEYLDRTQQ